MYILQSVFREFSLITICDYSPVLISFSVVLLVIEKLQFE